MKLISVVNPPPPPVPVGVVVEMSRAEAEAILAVLWKVGGNPHKSPRGHCDKIVQCLSDAGFQPCKEPIDGQIHFLNK